MSLDAKHTFLISDFHFDHTNIIEYCHRPFRNVTEMNETMLRNFNETVGNDDLVFFLGDMAYGRESRKPRWWLSQLNGVKLYIKGSHDHGIRPTDRTIAILPHAYLPIDGRLFLMSHEPQHYPDWSIHGHTHSTQMVDRARKRICVCVEATGYRPVSLERILEVIG